MKRRVGGLETEFGLVCVRSDGSRALEPEQAARELFRPVVAMGRSSNVFLANGARVYLDVGSHPEYATAECDNWWELVAQDLAGTAVFADLVAKANAQFASDGTDARIHLFKNNVDSAGNSFGSHENYLVDRRGEFTLLPRFLVPFLITRQLITGSGGVAPVDPAAVSAQEPMRAREQPHQFVFSRRSDHMFEAVSSATTRTRPIINTRDEPHGDPSRFRRLHVIVGDSTMSPISTWLRFATTDLVLRAIESGMPLPDLTVSEPITVIRQVARDLSGRGVIHMADGSSSSAIEIQQRWLDTATTVADSEEHEVLDHWQRAIDAVRTGDLSWARTRLDWAIKQELVTDIAQRRRVTLADPVIERLDLAYHDIDPHAGVFTALQQRGKAPSVITPDRIQRAREHPPATTRAHLRGQVVRAAREHGVDHVVDWTTMRLTRSGATPVQILDPFQTESDAVDALIKEIRSAADNAPFEMPLA